MSIKVVVALATLALSVTAVSAGAAASAKPGCRVPQGPTPILVEIKVSDGWGTVERLLIFRSGRAWTSWPPIFPGGYTPQLPCSKLTQVYDALERAQFATLRPEYVPEDPIFDAPSVSLTYLGRTVMVSPFVGFPGVDPPQRFVRALDLLARLWAAYHLDP